MPSTIACGGTSEATTAGKARGFTVTVCGEMPAVKEALDRQCVSGQLAGMYARREEALAA